MSIPERTTAAFCGIVAYLGWGFVALYFGILDDRGVEPLALLAHRIVWSAAFCVLLLGLMGRAREIACIFCDPARWIPLGLSSILIAVNWIAFVYAVDQKRLTEASLGYYLLPLVSVLLGWLVLRERLSRVQSFCLLLASTGVGILIWEEGQIPWIGVTVALSFGFYGLVRKLTPVGPIAGLAVETIFLVPLAGLYLGSGITPKKYDILTYVLLVLAGAITASLLMLYAKAAQGLKLSTLGFMQYIAPTCQLLVAMYLRPEQPEWMGFIPIWVALVIFSVHVAVRSRSSVRPVKIHDRPADSSTVRAGDS
ncbi:MAG: chloramphenicol resistance permease RarD [Phycisphaerae bacterium]|nr:MAG: chloramphenicol resistance permease RarD [Phycisphaerae bacterium]